MAGLDLARQVVERVCGVVICHRSKRYGKPSPKIVAWEPRLVTGLDEWYLHLNRFLLDDVLPDGDKCSFQFEPRMVVPLSLLTGSVKDVIKAAVRLGVGIRRNQYFWDGNHRTAILVVLELLAMAGVHCVTDVVTLYLLFSNGGNQRHVEDWNSRTFKIERVLKRSCRRLTVTPAHRERKALEVKRLCEWNTLFEEMCKCTHGQRSSKQCRMLRTIKRQCPRLYLQWTRLCGERLHE